jgi:hypothetical protein
VNQIKSTCPVTLEYQSYDGNGNHGTDTLIQSSSRYRLGIPVTQSIPPAHCRVGLSTRPIETRFLTRVDPSRPGHSDRAQKVQPGLGRSFTKSRSIPARSSVRAVDSGRSHRDCPIGLQSCCGCRWFSTSGQR